jgi:Protein of unknown function (DUF664)
MTDNDRPWEPPLAGSEAEHLVGALDRLRTTFRWKADALDAVGLQTHIGASSLSLGGLLKHLARAEEQMFSTKLSGAPLSAPWDAVDWDTDPDWDFNSAANDTPERLYAIGMTPSNGPGPGSTRPWPTADSTSSSTSPGPMGAMPACAGCSAT